MTFFRGFKGSPQAPKVIWQEIDSLLPFSCTACFRDFPEGGKRYVGSALNGGRAKGCRCDDCHKGIDPHRKKAPVMAERRTELD